MPNKDKPSNVLQFPITAQERDLQIKAGEIEDRWREHDIHVEGLHLTENFIDDEEKSSRIKNILHSAGEFFGIDNITRRKALGLAAAAVILTGGAESQNKFFTPHNENKMEHSTTSYK
jgi:hypothetical protein